MTEQQIVEEVGRNFRCFGGGKYTVGNPVSFALADKPLAFAAGVDVAEVVRFVLDAKARKARATKQSGA